MIPRDKQLHFVAGVIIGAVVAVATKSLGWAAIAAFLFGIAKEGLDWCINKYLARKGKPPEHDVDVYDAMWTTLGGLLVVLVGAFFSPPAHAQTRILVKPNCIPTPANGEIYANSVGICLQFFCPIPGDSAHTQVITYCGTWAEFAKVPGRVATIKKAADPLKSLQTLGSRVPIVALDDPSMAGLPIPK